MFFCVPHMSMDQATPRNMILMLDVLQVIDSLSRQHSSITGITTRTIMTLMKKEIIRDQLTLTQNFGQTERHSLQRA